MRIRGPGAPCTCEAHSRQAQVGARDRQVRTDLEVAGLPLGRRPGRSLGAINGRFEIQVLKTGKGLKEVDWPNIGSPDDWANLLLLALPVLGPILKNSGRGPSQPGGLDQGPRPLVFAYRKLGPLASDGGVRHRWRPMADNLLVQKSLTRGRVVCTIVLVMMMPKMTKCEKCSCYQRR